MTALLAILLPVALCAGYRLGWVMRAEQETMWAEAPIREPQPSRPGAALVAAVNRGATWVAVVVVGTTGVLYAAEQAPQDAIVRTAAAVSPLDDPAASAGEVRSYTDRDPWLRKTTGYRPSVMMIGDSITAWGEPYLRRLHATWEVSAVPGRNVCTAPYRVRERLMNPSPLRLLVIALGTNACPGWGDADYRALTRMVPASTRVLFVTTWRSAAVFPTARTDYRRRAVIQPHYSATMRSIAATRPGTCVADWARWAAPRYRVATRDGVHPSVYGNRYGWAPLVRNAVLGCLR